MFESDLLHPFPLDADPAEAAAGLAAQGEMAGVELLEEIE
jgi:hypothetical protein